MMSAALSCQERVAMFPPQMVMMLVKMAGITMTTTKRRRMKAIPNKLS